MSVSVAIEVVVTVSVATTVVAGRREMNQLIFEVSITRMG